jgi:outer membrane protein assembly factor BamB
MADGFAPSPAVDADRVYAATGNGVDESYRKVAAPNAASLVCFDKKTGQALWKDASPGKDILHAQRSSPLLIEVKGRTQVVVGQGDGWLRSFAAESGHLLWKCDLNPKGAKYEGGGRGRRSYVMATPVYDDGRIYLAPGQDPEHGAGENQLYCIDPNGDGDVSAELDDGSGKGQPNPNSRVVWRFGGPALKADAEKLGRDYLFSRTQANCTVHDGLVYVCDIEGFFFCLDAKTGRLQWWHDLRAGCWATPLWVDGKIYVPTEDGDVWIFAHGRDKRLLKQIDMGEAIRAMPIYANGTLYVMTEGTLFAIRAPKPRRPDVIFQPTPQGVVEKMLDLAGVQKDDVVADLGCGDGRILVTAAKKYGCKAVGYDLDKACVRLARENVQKEKVEKLVQIEQKDILEVDLSGVTVVTLYLGPTLNAKLIPQLQKMKPGSRIISHGFDMPGVKPDKVIDVTSREDDITRKVYLWTTPLKKESSGPRANEQARPEKS